MSALTMRERRDLAEGLLIAAAERGSCPAELDVDDVSAVALRTPIVATKRQASHAADLLELVVDVVDSVAKRKPRRSPWDDLLFLLVRSAQYAEARDAYLDAAPPAAVREHPAPPLVPMPKPAFVTHGHRSFESSVQADVKQRVAKAKVPRRRIGTAKDYRAELRSQTLAEFYAPQSPERHGPTNGVTHAVSKAFERAVKQIAKQHRELGFARNGKEEISFSTPTETDLSRSHMDMRATDIAAPPSSETRLVSSTIEVSSESRGYERSGTC